MNTQLPVCILLYSNADFQNYKTHILTWFDQQFYTAQPWLLSLSATHLYCWYAWLFYSVDHVWFNMPGYINSSETQMATQVLEKRLGCFAVVTHYIPLLIVTKSNRRSTSRGRPLATEHPRASQQSTKLILSASRPAALKCAELVRFLGTPPPPN